MDSEKMYKPFEFAKLLNVTVRTLQRWDREGDLVAKRTPTERRYYTHEQYLSYIQGFRADKVGESMAISVKSNASMEDMVQQFTNLVAESHQKGLEIELIRVEGISRAGQTDLNQNLRE